MRGRSPKSPSRRQSAQRPAGRSSLRRKATFCTTTRGTSSVSDHTWAYVYLNSDFSSSPSRGHPGERVRPRLRLHVRDPPLPRRRGRMLAVAVKGQRDILPLPPGPVQRQDGHQEWNGSRRRKDKGLLYRPRCRRLP